MVETHDERSEENISFGGIDPKDPTKNVLDLVRAESKYQDGMREAQDRLHASKIESIQEIVDLREEYATQLRAAESLRVGNEADIRAEYAEKLSMAESKRIDAIRLVDVNAVSVANERSAAQATVLANQVAQSAETLRSLVATTATQVAANLQQVTTMLSDRITKLEQAGYQAVGRSAFADPAFTDLLAEVKGLRESRTLVTGRGEGFSTSWAIIVAVAMMAIPLLVFAVNYTNSKSTTTAPPVYPSWYPPPNSSPQPPPYSPPPPQPVH